MKKGFTLIELMVVISIIAVLSAIVLAALSATRVKGKNAAVQDGVIELRNQIELGYNGVTGVYSDLSGDTPTFGANAPTAFWNLFGPSVTAIASSTLNQNNSQSLSANYGGGPLGSNGCGSTVGVNAIPTGYSLYENLNGLTIFTDASCAPAKKYAIFAAYGPTIGSSGYYCIDSSGNSISKTTGYIPQVLATSIACQ